MDVNQVVTIDVKNVMTKLLKLKFIVPRRNSYVDSINVSLIGWLCFINSSYLIKNIQKGRYVHGSIDLNYATLQEVLLSVDLQFVVANISFYVKKKHG